MNSDDYTSLWRTQNPPAPALSAPAAALPAGLLDRIRKDALRLDRTVFWRDTRETTAAFLVAAFFAFEAWRHTENGYVAWGRWIAVAITLRVALVFLAARRAQAHPTPADLPLLEQIESSLAKLRGQVAFLQRVPRDYTLPLFLATLCAGFDPLLQQRGLAGLWSPVGGLVFIIAAAVAGLVIWLNRLAVRRVLRPKIAELTQLRDELA